MGWKPYAALVLAAGRGTRFGGGKMLAELDGRPMLQHVLDLAAAVELDPVVVVLGAEADAVERAMSWRREVRVRNPDPDRGISSSVRLGLAALSESKTVLVMLGDQPSLTLEQVRSLLAAAEDTSAPIVVPRYADGRAGNPVVLASDAFKLAASLEDDRGMSQLFAAHPDLVRYVDVVGTNPGIDTPAQLAAWKTRAVVASGYDALEGRYVDWATGVIDPTRERILAEFTGRLPPHARVLDLGCGPGTTWTEPSASSLDITGVDLSAVQLTAARRRLPAATLIEADMTAIDFPPASFDGVVALYSFNHVPRDEQAALMGRIGRWLRVGGLLLATFSANDSPDWTGEWLGVPMFFSGYESARNLESLTAAGFTALIDEAVDIAEPDGPARFQWILAELVSRA